MMRLDILAIAALPLSLLVAAAGSCNDDTDTGAVTDTTSTSSSGQGAAGGSGGGTGTGGVGGFISGTGGGGGGESCIPPDMLIVLDRTMSMHREPNGQPAEGTTEGKMLSKWYIAVTTIESATATLQGGIRFGLELFPVDPGGGVCVTLEQRINGTTATNVQCEEGEVLVQPAVNSAAAIATAIDPDTTRLCRSTPIGAGLTTAKDALAAIATPERDQYALLITDGQDTCDANLPLAETQALAQAGVKTYVVGFEAAGGTGVDPEALNNLACAGMTATGFPAPCIDDGNGSYTWDSSAAGPPVYLVAEDEEGLATALDDIAAAVCCDCIS